MTIETKFNIGDEVWFLYHYKARQGRISHIGKSASTVTFGVDAIYDDVILNHLIFKTKEELIESLFN